MTKKITIEELAGIVQDGFAKTVGDITSVRSEVAQLRSHMDKSFSDLRNEVKIIHADLLKHDERADKMARQLQDLARIDTLRASATSYTSRYDHRYLPFPPSKVSSG